MTRGSESSDPPAPDSLSSESERRRWQHKRAQFDTAINTARLLGVVENLAMGHIEAREALRIILEVNSSKDQAQYVAEMLAMKKEFRDLARLEYGPEVAKFILEGSRLVPSLTGGLASQMLMAMGHAAQNDAYLETVSSAVSTLLSDLDHPLMPDARNYLRLLWEQMEATRRLKQTEALYTGQRSASDRAAERRSSGSIVASKPASAKLPEASKVAPVARETASISPSRTMVGIGQAPLVVHPDSPEPKEVPQPKKHWVEAEPSESQVTAAPIERPSPAPEAPSVSTRSILSVPPSRPSQSKRWVEAEPQVDEAVAGATPPTPAAPAPAAPAPATPAPAAPAPPNSTANITLLPHEQEFFAASVGEPEPTAEIDTYFEQPVRSVPRVPSDTIADTQNFDTHSDTLPSVRQRQSSINELKVPTRGVPKWAVASVVAVALAGSGLVLSLTLTGEPENKSESPQASAAESKKPAPSASAAVASSVARRPPRANAHPSAAGAPPAPPPPPPPPAPVTEPEPQPPTLTHRTPQKAPEPVSPPLPPTRTQGASPVQHREPAPATSPVAGPTSSKPSAEPAPRAPSVVTPPDVAKTLSPLDRIIAEIRLISPDPVGIEDKARELARIIAKSKRKEAGQILDKLGPPIAVDPLSRDSTLEDSLQTFAISVLGRVATDDDDNRAVDALLMLGEWVRNAGKGKQKALSALQVLSHESIIKTSAPRLRALKTAEAQAD